MFRRTRTADSGAAARFGIRTRLLAANSVVVVASVATTAFAAALIGPPMFERLMRAAVLPGSGNGHPYERAFEKATTMSVGTALAVSAITALALSWYLSRRVHRSATELAHAASVIADGHYEFRVSPTRLGKEFDEIATSFNTMAQRLGQVEESRRQMLADLAHEIRTPVAVLEAYLEALEDGVKPLDAAAIEVLRDQSRRLTRFSIDVTALSDAEHRTGTIDAGWVSMRQVVLAASGALEPRYHAKGVTLKPALSANLPVLWADPLRLGQVLTNLLDNALRHTPAGGSVSVTAHATDHEVVVAVSDTGDGIPPDHVTRVFDRFYRLDAARDRGHGGAGIGLAIAKALVEAHGGTIRADSAGAGAGSTFTLSLPRRSPREAETASPAVEVPLGVTAHR